MTFVAVSTSPYHLSSNRKYNSWFSIKDGSFFDKNTWRSNGEKRYNFPQPGDDVYIYHTVNFDFAANVSANTARIRIIGNTIRNLYVASSGVFKTGVMGNQVSIFIDGNLQCDGIFDTSTGSSGGGQLINIGGDNNWFNTLVSGTASANATIAYNSPTSFKIPSAAYYTLKINTGQSNWIENDLSITGLLYIFSGQLDLKSYNTSMADVFVDTISNPSARLLKSSSIGSFTVTNGALFGMGAIQGVSFSGSPTINWSGNIRIDTHTPVDFGNGTFNILTDADLFLLSGGNTPTTFGTNNVVIAAGKIVTLTGPAAWLNKGTVTGATSTSTLNVNTGYAYWSINTVMPTGIFDYNHSGTSAIYIYVNMTLLQSLFYDLYIGNGATGIANNNISVSRNLTIDVNSTFNIGSNNISIAGTSTISNSGVLVGSGSGSISFGPISTSSGKIDFSTASYSVAINGNISGDTRNGLNFGLGVATIASNITIGVWAGSNVEGPIAGTFIIASGVTLTNIGLSLGGANGTGGINLIGTITGASGSSQLINKSSLIVNSSTAPMITGVFDNSSNLNRVIFGAFGNQDISAGTYKNLTLNGSGVKKLLGNVSVQNTYTLINPALLDNNSFSLTNP